MSILARLSLALLVTGRQIPYDEWSQFANEFAYIFWGGVAIVLLSLFVYRAKAINTKINSVSAVFSSHYQPMQIILWWAVTTGVLVGIIFAYQFHEAFYRQSWPVAVFSGLFIAIIDFLYGFFVTYILVIAVPGITPTKFKYRPRRLFKALF